MIYIFILSLFTTDGMLREYDAIFIESETFSSSSSSSSSSYSSFSSSFSSSSFSSSSSSPQELAYEALNLSFFSLSHALSFFFFSSLSLALCCFSFFCFLFFFLYKCFAALFNHANSYFTGI